MSTNQLNRFLPVFLTVTACLVVSACGGSSSSTSSATGFDSSAAQTVQHAQATHAAYQQTAQALHVAYFGRPASPQELREAEQQLALANAPTDVVTLNTAYADSPAVRTLVDRMAASSDAKRLYGGAGNGPALIDEVYQNLLQRPASADEQTAWANASANGTVTIAQTALAVMASVLSQDSASDSLKALANRIAFAADFTQEIDKSGTASAYAGVAGTAKAKAMMARIDHTATRTAIQNKIRMVLPVLSTSGASTTHTTNTTNTTTTSLASPAYFVSPTGSNSNPGTQALPWKTLQYGVAKLKAGDTLYALNGTYAETVTINPSGTSAAPITVSAYPGQSPVIDGATLTVGSYASLLKLNGSYVTVTGFEIRNINNDGHGGNGGSATVDGGYGVSMSGISDTVSNLNVHNTWSQGILAAGDNSIIENSSISYVAMSNCRAAGQPNCSPTSRGWPSCVSAASPYGSGKSTHNAIIRGNTVFNCWGEGISTWLSNGTIIEDNVVYDNWAQNVYANNAWNTLIQRNIVYNTANNYVGKMAGFTLSDEVTSNTNNPTSGYPTVINNFVYNAPVCAFCWTLVSGTGLHDGLIANNTFVNPGLAAGVSSFSTGGSASTGNVVNVYSFIYNNIVVGAGYVPSKGGLTLSNNLWSATETPAAVGPGDVFGDPQLAKTGSITAGQLTAAYFQLLPTSPAIGKGKVLQTVATDFVGQAVGAPPNIGGYQAPAAL